MQAIKDFFAKLNNYLSLVFLFVVTLLGSFLYVEVERKKTDEELLKNDKVKSEVDSLNNEVVQDSASLQSEEEKRKLLEETLEKEQNENADDQDLADFFNNRK